MKFSVILPSLLEDYPGAAPGRDRKLMRAIDSVLGQTFDDFELIVVADGCRRTTHIVMTQVNLDEIPMGKLRLKNVPRTRLWSNNARNKGIEDANGEFILYIDSDDKWGPDHLQKIYTQLSENDTWVYWNDFCIFGDWIERSCDVTQYGKCGTSNICHASRLGVKWEKEGYGHDYHFIQNLRSISPGRKIETPEYYVCHAGQFSL